MVFYKKIHNFTRYKAAEKYWRFLEKAGQWQTTRTDEVADLVLSEEAKPQTHRSTRHISCDRYELSGYQLFVYSVEEATVGIYHCVMKTKDNEFVTGDVKLG